MRIFYECEICGGQYLVREEAEKCEAQGRLPLPTWLPMGKPVPCWGENGTEWAVVREFYCLHDCIRVETNRSGNNPCAFISHNLDPHEGLPLEAFDPREGFSPFRYVEPTEEDLRVWKQALDAYGFRIDEVDREWGMSKMIQLCKEPT